MVLVNIPHKRYSGPFKGLSSKRRKRCAAWVCNLFGAARAVSPYRETLGTKEATSKGLQIKPTSQNRSKAFA